MGTEFALEHAVTGSLLHDFATPPAGRPQPRGGHALQMPAPTPYLPDIGVISLVPYAWGGPWMSREHILTRLARYFHIVWADPAREWREWWLPGAPRRALMPATSPALAGFQIYRPGRWLPHLFRPQFLAAFTTQARLRQAERLLRRTGARRTILYLWRPEFEFALDRVRHDLACYQINDEYTFSDVELPLSPQEARLIRRVDQVIIHSAGLFEKKGGLNPHTALVPNGVDYAAFASPTVEPDDLRRIPHPRIGYVGIIKQQLDLPLLTRLAARHAEWSFVFVGPVRAGGEVVDGLARLSNVHFLGPKPLGALPAYAQHLDVCSMCYVLNDYTKFIYPLKLHEYLATGRPVVGTPIRSLREFQHVVAVASTTDEWSEALTRALAPEASAPSQVMARRRIAQEHDWHRLVAIIARTLCERLGPRDLERFDGLAESNLRA